jgi:putative transposase
VAILGPEIAHRSTGVFERAREQDRADRAAAAEAARPAAINVTVSDERRQTDRRRTGADHPGPERRAPADRRGSPDRRTVAERERRLTPAGRNALNLVATASESPVALTGEEGLLTALVTDILQRGLEVEIAAHLGHGRWESGARGAENIRNGAYSKRVLTDLGAIKVQMPRDRRGTFEPVIVPKHGRRLLAAAANVAAVYASGMTRNEIRSQLDTVTQSRLDGETVDQFTDELEPEVRSWQRRRFDSSYPVLLIDSITLAGRGTRSTRRALDVAVAITAYGDYELLGIWRRPARVQGAARWSPMLDELNYRGISSIEFICASSSSELAEAAEQVFPQAKVRPGVEALMENSLRTFE